MNRGDKTDGVLLANRTRFLFPFHKTAHDGNITLEHVNNDRTTIYRLISTASQRN